MSIFIYLATPAALQTTSDTPLLVSQLSAPPFIPGAENPLVHIEDVLQNALSALHRAENQSDYVQRAKGDVNLAIGDVTAAITFIKEHPGAETTPPSTSLRPDFTAPPRPAPNRNVMLELALADLKTAFDALERAGGGDLGGFRPRANNDISAAADDLIAGINAANASFQNSRGANTARQKSPIQ